MIMESMMESNRFSVSKEQYERSERIYKESIVIDCLTYIPGDDLSGMRALIEELIDCGVTACHVTVAPVYANYTETINHIGEWIQALEDLKDIAILAKSADDISYAKESGRVAIIMGLQNLKPLGNDLNRLDIFKQLGLRILQVTYQEQNLLGAGCAERTGSGLSNLGIEAVQKMAEKGFVVDISHCNSETTNDAIEFAKGPIVATHANPRNLTNDHIRNKTDEEIKNIAKTNGVIGINAWSGVGMRQPGVRPTIEDILDFVDHMVNLTSVDHVGLGLDFDPAWDESDYNTFKEMYPEVCGPFSWKKAHAEGLNNASHIPELVRGLIAREYSDEDINKILGGNFMRVFQQVWE